MALKQLTGDLEFFTEFKTPEKINVLEQTKGKKVPSYLEAKDELKALGIEDVMVYCVNDMAVMEAWGADQKIEGTHVSFYADPFGTFTKHFDMILDHEGPASKGLVGRSKRWAMYLDDGVVKYIAVAEDPDFDPAGDEYPEKTLPPAMMEAIKEIQGFE